MKSLKSIIKYLDKRLPAGYQEVEYIESTGTQYIDTGVEISSEKTYHIEYDIQFTNTSTRQLMGFGSGSNQYWGVAASGYYEVDNTSSSAIPAGGRDYVEWDYDYTNKIALLTINLTSTQSTNNTYFSNPFFQHLFIYRINIDDFYSSAKLYSNKVYEDGVLIRNFIPAVRNIDSVAGLYDIVNDVFYTNAGTGTFLKGADIKYKNSLRTYTASKNLNLLKLTRTEFNQANYQPTDTIVFDYNKIYYMAGSGYMRQYENNDFSETITNRSVEFIQGSSSWWGFGFPIKVKPSMKYTISAKRYDGNKTKLIYSVYNSDGTFSRYGQLTTNVNILDNTYTITMGANEDTLIVVVAGITEGDTIYAYDIQVEEGQTATEFMPYGKGAVKSICEKLKDVN